jgi:hypothetical protein
MEEIKEQIWNIYLFRIILMKKDLGDHIGKKKAGLGMSYLN